jgi:hypothetical protein
MTLGNMRQQGLHHSIAFCHNDACRHQALIDVSAYPPETPVTGERPGVQVLALEIAQDAAMKQR